MSGRSGYRKTDRKRNRHASPRPKSDYVLRFQLPKLLAAFLRPGEHGWGVTVGFNDVAFVTGQNPAHCAQLAAEFLNKIGARQNPQTIAATVVKLLPCPAHCPPAHARGFKPLSVDLEAIHDNISRNAGRARHCSIVVTDSAITFTGITPRHLIHEFTDSGTRKQAG